MNTLYLFPAASLTHVVVNMRGLGEEAREVRDSDGGERRGRWRSQANIGKEDKNTLMESSTSTYIHGSIWNEVTSNSKKGED